MKYIRIFLGVVVLLLVLGVGCWFLMGWMASRAFSSASQQGGLKQLSDVLEASVGGTLARSDSRLQIGTGTTVEGAIGYYRKNPQELERDKRYFETWRSALAIADSSLNGGHRLKDWKSSTELTWIAALQKADSWGHAFCVQSDSQRAIVVSPGPYAVSSFECSGLQLSESELAAIPQGRLSPHSSGALILSVKRLSPTHT